MHKAHVHNIRRTMNLKNVDIDYQVMGNDKVALDRWLPWVNKFIANSKAWVIGTHHGVESKYLARYLDEYTFRFNRRHDPNSLFSPSVNGLCKSQTFNSTCALCISIQIPLDRKLPRDYLIYQSRAGSKVKSYP